MTKPRLRPRPGDLRSPAAHGRGPRPRRRPAARVGRGPDARVGRRRGARPHHRHRAGDVLVAVAPRVLGQGRHLRPRAVASRRSASTATATRSSSSSTRRAPPATPATTPASTPTWCTGSMAEPGTEHEVRPATTRRTFGPVVAAGPRLRRARGVGRQQALGRRHGRRVGARHGFRGVGHGVGRGGHVAARHGPGLRRPRLLGRPAGHSREVPPGRGRAGRAGRARLRRDRRVGAVQPPRPPRRAGTSPAPGSRSTTPR